MSFFSWNENVFLVKYSYMTKSPEKEPKKKHLNTIPKFLQKLKGSFGPLNFKDKKKKKGERERERERNGNYDYLA